jgi:hypothetical protein
MSVPFQTCSRAKCCTILTTVKQRIHMKEIFVDFLISLTRMMGILSSSKPCPCSIFKVIFTLSFLNIQGHIHAVFKQAMPLFNIQGHVHNGHKWQAVLICPCEIQGKNIFPETWYSDWGSPWTSSVPPGIYCNTTLKYAKAEPFTP